MAPATIGVRRKSAISIPGHGGNQSDHQDRVIDANLKELALSCEAPVFSDSRSAALALPQLQREPIQTHESKGPPWTPKDAFYAFYDYELLDVSHQHFKL